MAEIIRHVVMTVAGALARKGVKRLHRLDAERRPAAREEQLPPPLSEHATVLPAGKVRASPSSPCSRPSALRVAPGGSGAPVPAAARGGLPGVSAPGKGRLSRPTRERLVQLRLRGEPPPLRSPGGAAHQRQL
ncbi:hypothetical protein GCM10009416_34350 [Craurococcus roseus]|uniref:Uncharacterized protein n=1 Tax=Craurococcus roseus TaxID=77585 RepID=A0ABP3QPJ9_9PROT